MMQIHRSLGLACLVLAGFLVPVLDCGAQSGMDLEVFSRVSANVFEVVAKKNTQDPLVYESPLPLHLLPFAERNDPYYSVGTAFALKDGTFASAAHVFNLIERSFRSEWGLRDSSGKVWALGKIRRYSYWRDYIVFEVPGLKAQGLEVAGKAEVNTKVYAVGNALGQGVISRDGLLTSFTPENWSGAWRWLRFSAPASPGNSGGPLVDPDGRVLGIIMLKSENENLNYALPFSEIGEEGKAHLDLRYAYSIPLFPKKHMVEIHQSFSLPSTVPELRAVLASHLEKENSGAARKIVTDNRAALFPDARESAKLFGNTKGSAVPTFVTQSGTGVWSMDDSGELKGSGLDGGKGYLFQGEKYGYLVFNVMHAARSKNDALIRSGRGLMDLILDGYYMSRNVAGQQTRILSFGDPSQEHRWTDRWGRRWFSWQWYMPDTDYAFMMTATATPEGAIALLRQAPYGGIQVYEEDLRVMTDFCNIAYQASIESWKAYLKQTDIIPQEMKTWQTDYLKGKWVGFSGSGIGVRLDQAQFPVDDTLRLTVYPAFYQEGSTAAWRPGAYFFDYPDKDKSSFAIYKVLKPGADIAPSDRRWWSDLIDWSYPFEGSPMKSQNGADYALITLGDPQVFVEDSLFCYYASLTSGKEKGLPGLKDRIRIMARAVAILPGEELVARGKDRPREEPRGPFIEGRHLFEWIRKGDLLGMTYILQGMTDLDIRNDLGDSPLIWALRNKAKFFIEALISMKKGLDSQDAAGRTALEIALTEVYGLAPGKGGVDHEVTLLAETATNRGTALRLALERGYDKLALVMLEAGAVLDPGTDPAWDLPGLVMKGKNLESGKYLIRNGPLPLKVSSYPGKQNILHLTAWYLPDLLSDLLATQGALAGIPGLVDQADASGMTPLALALRRGHLEGAEALLKAGAKIGNATGKGWTPLGLALRSGNPALVQHVLVWGDGLPRLWSESEGWTPLMLAARYNSLALEHLAPSEIVPAKLDKANPEGYTALHLAILGGNIDAVEWLLARGANRTLAGPGGKTPLDMARDRHVNAAVRLLEGS